MTGSLRQRGPDSWQLRVYVGTDAATGKQRWATTTVHGSRRFATRQLAEFVRQVDDSKVRAGTIAELLDRWVDVAGPTWEPSTRRENWAAPRIPDSGWCNRYAARFSVL